MACAKRVVLYQLLWLSMASGLACAEQVTEELPFYSNTVAQWLVVADGQGTQIIDADLHKTTRNLVVSAEVSSLPVGALVGAVVELKDGKFVSSPMHLAGGDGLDEESATLAQDKLRKITQQIEASKLRIASLEASLVTEDERVRREAGLLEVDKINKTVEELKVKVERKKAAIQQALQLQSALGQ